METSDLALQRRVQELEVRLQNQTRQIRALERIEGLLDRSRELEAENRYLREKVEELRTFWSLGKTLSATLNMEELLRLTLHLIGRSLHVEAYSLMLLEEGGDRLTVRATFGLPDHGGEVLTLGLGEGISGMVAQTGRPMLVPDVSAEPRFVEWASLGLTSGSFICVPLRVNGGEVRGVLNAHKPDPHALTASDLDLFQAVANQVAAALENAQLYQRTKELSSHDDLTGLFNRRAFFDNLDKEVQRARRYRRTFCILMLDLDHFKKYNDTHGHLKGDDALKGLAHLLLANTRRADVVARYGGEEFVILLPEVSMQGGAVVAEKIRTGVEQHPFYGRSQQPGGKVTVTIGVAAYPQDSEDGLGVVDVADRAMYMGKQQGGNRVMVLPRADASSSGS